MHPGLERASYEHQLASRYDTLFGVADFYSLNFRALGHQATEIFVNNAWLQCAWANEHGMKVPLPLPPTNHVPGSGEMIMTMKRKLHPIRTVLAPLAKKLGYMASLSQMLQKILLAQVEAFEPDVILNQIPELVTSDIMSRTVRRNRILIVQHGNSPPANFDARPYTFAIAIVPSIIEFFRAKGLPAEYYHLGFEPAVLDRLSTAPEKDIAVSFIGGLSSNHTQRIALLEAVASEFPIALHLSQFAGIPSSSPLRRHVRGEVWGREMYEIMRRSKITLNSHIDAAGGVAANLRLYEATGVGTFLLTDNLRGLPDLFAPGTHVAAYNSAADCVSKIKHYLAHEAEREAIARAGQAHTLAHHNYRNRMQSILSLVTKYGN